MTTLLFKYQLINEAGQPTGWLSKKGSFDGEQIHLDGESFPATSIVMTLLVKKVFVFVVDDQVQEPRTISLVMHSGNTQLLKTEVDRIRSADQVAKLEAAWRANGQMGPFRKEMCPNCAATLDLSHFDATPQIFCDS